MRQRNFDTLCTEIINPCDSEDLPAKIKEALKVQSCISYNNKYMIASTQRANTEIFAFLAVQVFKLWSRKVLFINKKDNRNC